MLQERIYPQVGLCDEDELMEEELPAAPRKGSRIASVEQIPLFPSTWGSYEVDDGINLQYRPSEKSFREIREWRAKMELDETENGGEPADEADIALKTSQIQDRLEKGLILSFLMYDRRKTSREVFLENKSHLEMFGEVNDKDVPELEMKLVSLGGS